MTPTAALIVAQPAQPPALRPSSEIIGLRNAINRCGGWPDAGTVEQFCEGVYLAGRQLDRIEAIWARYSRRFALLGAEIDVAPTRLWARHHTIRDIYEARAESSRMLIRDAVAGCA